MKAANEIALAGALVLIVFGAVWAVLANFEELYDGGCAMQMSLHPSEYSKCVRCGNVRPNKHMSNVRGVGMVCDTHLGLEE